MLQQEVGPGRLVCRDLAAIFVVVLSSTKSGWCLLLTASPGEQHEYNKEYIFLCFSLCFTNTFSPGSYLMYFVIFTSVQIHLDGRFLSVVRTCRAKTQTKCPELLPESFCIQTMTATPTTTTSLCSDSPHQSNSQTTSDLCVWQPVAVCSITVLKAGWLAGEQSRREVSLLELLTTFFILVLMSYKVCRTMCDLFLSLLVPQCHYPSLKLYKKWRCQFWETDSVTVSMESAQSQRTWSVLVFWQEAKTHVR